MNWLIALSRGVDALTGGLGRAAAWLIVLAAAIGAGNAVIRKVFSISSNAWLDAQWWLFALVFLLAAPWTLAQNEHIRIDVVNARFSKRTRDLVDVIGHVLFLLPVAGLLTWTGWRYAHASFLQNEQALNAGGLPQWPIKALIPVAFALLFVQGLSELIKRIAILRGDITDPNLHGSYHDAALTAGAGHPTDADR